jgi:hypothetical protein
MESLRQKCLWNYLEDTKEEDTDKYFGYMAFYEQSCALMKIISEKCSEEGFEKVKVEKEIIQECVKKSFSYKTDYKKENNQLLSEEMAVYTGLGVAYYPSLYINMAWYKGQLTMKEIKEALCGSLIEKPMICSVSRTQRHKETSFWELLIVALIVFLIAFLISAIVCRKIAERKARSEYQRHISSLVTQYVAMNEGQPIRPSQPTA